MISNLNGRKEIKVNSIAKTEEVESFKESSDIPKVLPNNYTGGFIKHFVETHKKLVKVLKIVILVLIAEIMFITFYFGTNRRIFGGVSIEGIDLGGKTRSEAIEILNDKLESEVISKELTLYYGSKYGKVILLSDIIDSLDYNMIARDAQRVGREGNLFKRMGVVIDSHIHGKEVSLKYSVNMSKLRQIVYNFKDEVDKEAVNATYEKKHGSDFVIKKESIGLELNVAKTLDKIREIVENNTFEECDCKIEAVVEKINPTDTKEKFISYSTELSSYQTEYMRSDEERMNKLTLAANKLDKALVEADEEFSFNKVMGETITKGSKEDSDNNDEINVQIATTLYNAVILAGLDVTERTNCDSLPDYIDIGRDALVYGTKVDFKFKNTTTNPVYIECYTYNGKLVVRLYGSENFKTFDSVSFERKITTAVPSNEIIENYDPKLKPGERIITQVGKSGATAKLKVIYKVLGKKAYEVTLPDSVYLPTPTRISIGDRTSQKEDSDEEKDDNKVYVKTSGTITIGDDEDTKDDKDDTKGN